MMKWSLSVTRKLAPKFCTTPPTRNEGLSPPTSATHVAMLVVVVFPCVPATPSERRPRIDSSLTPSRRPRRGARRGRLPGLARDDKRPPPADKLFLHRFGLRAIEKPASERLFPLR